MLSLCYSIKEAISNIHLVHTWSLCAWGYHWNVSRMMWSSLWKWRPKPKCSTDDNVTNIQLWYLCNAFFLPHVVFHEKAAFSALCTLFESNILFSSVIWISKVRVTNLSSFSFSELTSGRMNGNTDNNGQLANGAGGPPPPPQVYSLNKSTIFLILAFFLTYKIVVFRLRNHRNSLATLDKILWEAVKSGVACIGCKCCQCLNYVFLMFSYLVLMQVSTLHIMRCIWSECT